MQKILKNVYNAVKNANRDIQQIGGGQVLRENKYGVEHHFQWRVMYHLEKQLDKIYLQSPEIKTTYKTGKRYDWGLPGHNRGICSW